MLQIPSEDCHSSGPGKSQVTPDMTRRLPELPWLRCLHIFLTERHPTDWPTFCYFTVMHNSQILIVLQSSPLPVGTW